MVNEGPHSCRPPASRAPLGTTCPVPERLPLGEQGPFSVPGCACVVDVSGFGARTLRKEGAPGANVAPDTDSRPRQAGSETASEAAGMLDLGPQGRDDP